MLALSLPLYSFGQISFTASTERTRIAMGEQVTVIAAFVTDRQIPGLAIPSVIPDNSFSLLRTNSQQSSSSSIQIVNGKTHQTNTITTSFFYYITPRKTGSFVFPSLSITLDGTTYKTKPIQFTVSDQPVSNPDIRIFLSLSHRTLYPGEQALLTFKVAQRAQAQGSTDVRNGFNDALKKIEEAFGKSFSLTRLFTNQVTSSSEQIDGERYNVFSLRFSLFPLAAGDYTIPAIPYEFQELKRSRRRSDPFFDDFFGGSIFGGGVQATARTAFSNPFSVTVKTLPAAPEGYTGAVGSFSLRASASPQEIPAGEAVTLKVSLRGNTRPGNIGDITVPSSDEYELFTPEKQVAVDTVGAGIATRKTYKYLLIPKNEGTLEIPSIVYYFFDPKSGTYKTAQSDPITITVIKGKGGKKEQTRYLTQEEIREIGRDIRYIKTNVSLKSQARYPYREPLFFLLFPLPLIFLVLALLYRFQSTRKELNVAQNLKNKALAAALKQISLLKKQHLSLDPNTILGKISTTIENYISHKFGFPATGRTLEELKSELLNSTSDTQTVADLTAFIEQIDHYRFGGASLDDASRISLLEKAGTFLTGLERGTRKEKRS